MEEVTLAVNYDVTESSMLAVRGSDTKKVLTAGKILQHQRSLLA
jgi:hypothetical protein